MKIDWDTPVTLLAFLLGAAAIVAAGAYAAGNTAEASVECVKLGGTWAADGYCAKGVVGK